MLGLFMDRWWRLVALLLVWVSTAVDAAGVTGAGSSFAGPIFSKWADAFMKSGAGLVNYQSIGSAAGIKQVEAGTVDFAASDMPLSETRLHQAGLVEFPIVFGGVVPVVHINGITNDQLKLTGPILADIYLGAISRWSDARIKALNPGLNLPDTPIAVIHRADGAGTSFVFTDYLSKVSPAWRNAVGVTAAPEWRVGAGAKGNEGVAMYVRRLPNAIGYLEYNYAHQGHGDVATVQLLDSEGVAIAASGKGFLLAASAVDWNRSVVQSLTDVHVKGAWPIVAATFVVIPKAPQDVSNAKVVVDFCRWVLSAGDIAATSLNYVPLPDAVKAVVKDKVLPQIVISGVSKQ